MKIVPVFLALSPLLMAFISSSNGQGATVIETSFVKEAMLCDVTARLAKGCSREVTARVRNQVECASLCGRQESCLGASLDDQGQCFLHEECLSIDGGDEEECSVEDDTTISHRYLAEYCGLGTWEDLTKTCQCVRGMHGVRCDKYPKDCLFLTNYDPGYYKVILDPQQNGRDRYVIGCRVSPGRDVQHILAMNYGGVKSFNRTWEEYVKGIYTDENHSWAGLELWYLLCKDGCTIQYTWTFKSVPSLSRQFHHFVVSNASSYYQINYNSTSAENVITTNCFVSLKGIPFSTWDRDNDGEDAMNCAARAGSGWWYNATGCDTPCHVLGLGYEYRGTDTPTRMHFLGMFFYEGVGVEIYIISRF